MNRTVQILSGIALGLVISVGAQAKEKQIKQSDLPAAVQKSAVEHSTGATITGYTRDKVEGVMVYQMDLVVEGRTRGIVMDPDGTVLQIEQEIAWDQLPADVQTDLNNVAGKGKYGAVSTITKEGKLVAYEAELVTNGNKAHVQVKPKAVTLDAIPVSSSR
jgi:hypothetical protein